MSKYEYKDQLFDVVGIQLQGPEGYILSVDLGRGDGVTGEVIGARVKHIGTQEVFYSGDPDEKFISL